MINISFLTILITRDDHGSQAFARHSHSFPRLGFHLSENDGLFVREDGCPRRCRCQGVADAYSKGSQCSEISQDPTVQAGVGTGNPNDWGGLEVVSDFLESWVLFDTDFGSLREELLESGTFYSTNDIPEYLSSLCSAQLLTDMKVLPLPGLTDAKDPRGAWCYVEPGQCSDEEQSMVFPQRFLSYKVCSYLVDP